MSFVEITPPLGSNLMRYMLEPFTLSLSIKIDKSITQNLPLPLDLASQNLQSKLCSIVPAVLTAQIWTNSVDKYSPEGKWHEIDMFVHIVSFDEKSSLDFEAFSTAKFWIIKFQGAILPTATGSFEYTIRWKCQDSNWNWANKYGKNGVFNVKPPSPDSPWTHGPRAVEIEPDLYIGNYIAASRAKKMGFQAVLTVAKELELPPEILEGIEYLKVPLKDGANNRISDHDISTCVKWVQGQLENKRKTLVHCRAGMGRSGSIGIAYIYFHHQNFSYRQALQHAWSKKPDIYPHIGLHQSLERLYPRL
ncbi:protein tyrosine phosphatase [Gigaspora margarita]|uniref:protein-tyrosine-phosphatase n=1 Tax=Gigaspora margarita TaxID=4874 RepID=A0A8H4A1F7_GIGMA|nr:protein tyrosine phosphatase [Gigaspora margarita]